jgi:hypothetical protein
MLSRVPTTGRGRRWRLRGDGPSRLAFGRQLGDLIGLGARCGLAALVFALIRGCRDRSAVRGKLVRSADRRSPRRRQATPAVLRTGPTSAGPTSVRPPSSGPTLMIEGRTIATSRGYQSRSTEADIFATSTSSLSSARILCGESLTVELGGRQLRPWLGGGRKLWRASHEPTKKSRGLIQVYC